MTEESDKDVAFIQALADMVNAADLAEIEVERGAEGGETLKVRLTRNAVATVSAAPPAAVAQPVPPAPAAPAAAPATPTDAAPAASSGPDLSKAVTSPMVGTVYLAPEPGAAAFVQEGDQVQEGQTLLIIEAMKTMNQIPSPRAGRVVAVLVENAEPVEFGEPLVIIE